MLQRQLLAGLILQTAKRQQPLFRHFAIQYQLGNPVVNLGVFQIRDRVSLFDGLAGFHVEFDQPPRCLRR